MTLYLEIAVNVPQAKRPGPTEGIFHYHLPFELEGLVQRGNLVIVPFGPRTVQGVVLDFVDRPEGFETRPGRALVNS